MSVSTLSFLSYSTKYLEVVKLAIHNFDIFCVPDYNSDFEFFFGSLSYFPNWSFNLIINVQNFHPHLNCTHEHFTFFTLKLSLFNGMFGEGLPNGTVVPVFQVNHSRANQLVLFYQVVVPQLNLKLRPPWDYSVQFVHLVFGYF
jgi:hypothetical protein